MGVVVGFSLLCGCKDTTTTSSLGHKSSEEILQSRNSPDVLAKVIEDNLGTSGTLRTDYKATLAFLKSHPNDESFSGLKISPIDHFVDGFDSSVTLGRDFMKLSYNKVPTGITKYLIFCRLMRNASLATDPNCRSQLVRDAVTAMQHEENSNIADRRGKYDVLKDICRDLIRNEDACREFPLRYLLAINIVQINNLGHPKKSGQFFSHFLQRLGVVELEFSRCKSIAQRSAYLEFYEEVFRELRKALDPAPIGMCHDDLMSEIPERIDSIDKRLRPLMTCY